MKELIQWCRAIRKARRNRKNSKKWRNRVEIASRLYQIREYDGKAWFTFDGCLICPCSMIEGDYIEAFKEMRRLYYIRNL